MPLVDIGIITALREEFIALRDVLELEEILSSGSTTFYRGSISAGPKTYKVVATFLQKQGNLDAASVTLEMLNTWEPAYLFLVGICGGLHKDVSLGDVVISDQVIYYEPRKETDKGVERRIEAFRASSVLINQFGAFSVDPHALERWRAECDGEPKIEIGAFACGEAVVAAAAKKEELRQIHSKFYAVEREAAGMMNAACYNADKARTIVVKGISDHADMTKSRTDEEVNWREAAKRNSALLLRHTLERGALEVLSADEFEVDTRLAAAAEARSVLSHDALDACYLAFPRIVVPHGPLTELVLTAVASDSSGPLRPVEAVVRYVPYGSKNGTVAEYRIPDPASLAIGVTLERVASEAVGLFATVVGDVSRVSFSLSTPHCSLEAEWQRDHVEDSL